LSEDIKSLLEKAEDSAGAARTLLIAGYPGFAAARAYFAMFYIAQAFLETRGLSYSKHSAVISAFGFQFAKTGIIDVKFHRYLIDAQEVRLAGDYEAVRRVTAEQANLHIKRAEEFLHLANQRFTDQTN